MASGCWWYYISKFTEFFDTIFFVMRKRYDQVSTLHVIHHGLMPASVWWGVKFTAGGHSSFFGFLNTFVHILMYAYYMLAAMGPRVQRFLWWKKYLTLVQMVQFVLVMLHAFQLLVRNECNYPVYFAYFIGAHALLFYFLFAKFYKQTYKAKVGVSFVRRGATKLMCGFRELQQIAADKRAADKTQALAKLLGDNNNDVVSDDQNAACLLATMPSTWTVRQRIAA